MLQLLAALQDTTDGISHWFACLAVVHQIRGNDKAKTTFLAIKVCVFLYKLDIYRLIFVQMQVHENKSQSSPLLTTLLGSFNCTGMQQVSYLPNLFEQLVCSFFEKKLA